MNKTACGTGSPGPGRDLPAPAGPHFLPPNTAPGALGTVRGGQAQGLGEDRAGAPWAQTYAPRPRASEDGDASAWQWGGGGGGAACRPPNLRPLLAQSTPRPPPPISPRQTMLGLAGQTELRGHLHPEHTASGVGTVEHQKTKTCSSHTRRLVTERGPPEPLSAPARAGPAPLRGPTAPGSRRQEAPQGRGPWCGAASRFPPAQSQPGPPFSRRLPLHRPARQQRPSKWRNARPQLPPPAAQRLPGPGLPFPTRGHKSWPPGPSSCQPWSLPRAWRGEAAGEMGNPDSPLRFAQHMKTVSLTCREPEWERPKGKLPCGKHS